MDRERLDKWCENGIFGLVVAILVFGPLATGAVRTLEFLVIQAMVMGVVLLWVVRLWIRPNYRLLWPPICWSVLAFTTYAIVRYQQADLEYVARGELLRVIVYAFVFLAALDNLHRQELTQRVVYSLLLVAMLISLYAVYQFLTDSRYVWHFLKPEQYLHRGTGTYICPNNLAGFLEMILPLGLACVLVGRFKPITKVLLGYAALATLAGIGVSLSRGGWIATAGALLVLFTILVSYRESRLPAVVCLVLLLGVGGFFFKQGFQAQKRWQLMFQETGRLDDFRFYLWKPAIQIWKEHFWWGAGPAHFDYRFPAVRPGIIQLRPGRVHNDYLNTLADWGVVGTVIVASAWVLLFWGVFRTWKYVRRSSDLATKPSNRAAFVLGASIGLLALLFHSLLDFNMHIPANALVAITLMALLTGYLRFMTERYWVSVTLPIRISLTIASLIGLAYLAQQTVIRGREYVFLERADRAHRTLENRARALETEMDSTTEVNLQSAAQLSREIEEASHEEIRMLKRANDVEPTNFETTYRIGQALRTLSWHGREGYREQAQEAMDWFNRGMKLNPFDAYNFFRYGMCLDWLGRHADAEPYYRHAVELDPNSYFVLAHAGWHFFTAGEFDEAKRWFERSQLLKLPDWRVNQIADYYLRLITNRVTEKAVGH